MQARASSARGPARTLLDLGCGRADFSLLLARAFPALRVLGVDDNPAAIAHARERAAAAALPNARFACEDASRLERMLAGGEVGGAAEL